MSDDRGPERLAKWPFYLADLVLSGVVFFVLYQLGTFEGTTDMVIVAVCLAVAAIAAWISIVPWLKEHDARVHIGESSNLKTSLEQIKGVEKVADLIRQSNTQWQGIQDASARTVTSAREISEKMKGEAEEFMKFLSNAHDQERAGLRLEVEKLRRMEGDWLKVNVQILDHIFALHRAAERSGQQQLIAQLTQFQNACRDLGRRMGLSPFVPVAGESFDQRTHQLPDQNGTAHEGARVRDVLATGFTYQGQLLRRSLVLVEESGDREADSRTPESTANEPAADPVEAGERSIESQPPEEVLPETNEFPAAEEQYDRETTVNGAIENDEERGTEIEEHVTQPPQAKRRTGQEELPF